MNAEEFGKLLQANLADNVALHAVLRKAMKKRLDRESRIEQKCESENSAKKIRGRKAG